jgi:hypothetical protein
MEVLFFNLSLNLRSPHQILIARAGPELPPSLTSKTPNHYSPRREGPSLADLRSTALLQSSLLLNFSFQFSYSTSSPASLKSANLPA